MKVIGMKTEEFEIRERRFLLLSLIFDLCPHSGSKVPDSRGIFYVGRWEVERRGGREMERIWREG